MKCAIVYASIHHSNTHKLLDAIAKECDVDLLDAISGFDKDLNDYDIIGFASGIYLSSFHKSVLRVAKDKLPDNKEVFFIYTCGVQAPTYLIEIRRAIKDKNPNILGEYHCLGYDTIGPFKVVGGIAKGHPTQEEIFNAVDFMKNIINT